MDEFETLVEEYACDEEIQVEDELKTLVGIYTGVEEIQVVEVVPVRDNLAIAASGAESSCHVPHSRMLDQGSWM